MNFYALFVQFYAMTVHIGSVIKDFVKAKGITVEEFANKINCTRRNAYKIFDKPSIDTELLLTINKALGENLFFKYIKDDEIASFTNDKIKSGQLLEALKDLNATYIALKEEKDMKKRVMAKKKEIKSKSTKKTKKG